MLRLAAGDSLTPQPRNIAKAKPDGHLDNARGNIDTEIDRVTLYLCDLRSQRNNLSPISKLPPELMSRVFSLCASAESHPRFRGHVAFDSLTVMPEWVKVTWVCRRWREVAIGCAALWTKVDFSSSKWTAEMLKRSKNASLVVKADLTFVSPRLVRTVELATSHISRTRELELLAPKQTLEALARQLRSPAPFLESLHLSSSRFSNHLADGPCSLPDDIFEGQVPQLRRLELYRCRFKWNSPLLSTTLTHLHITEASNHNPARPTLSQILPLLQGMPLLQSLHLEYAAPVPSMDVAELWVPENITLRNLTSISLIDVPHNCAALLSRLDLPSRTDMKLTCLAPAGTQDEFSRILPILSKHYAPTEKGDLSIQSLSIEALDDTRMRFRGWAAQGILPRNGDHFTLMDGTGPRDDITPRIDLVLSWHTWSIDKPARLIESIAPLLSLEHLQTLSVKGFEYVPKKVWVDTFGKLTQLGVIRVSRSVAGFVDSLYQDNGSELKVPMPGLRKIQFEGADLAEQVNRINVFNVLQRNLTSRIAYERERDDDVGNIQVISMTRCSGIRDDQVSSLRRILSVLWDGLVGYGEDTIDLDEFQYFGEWAHWPDVEGELEDFEEMFGLPF
ncbi:hypothetical protein JAAARDRAFT_35480 [Jaapia argillacea MUCL 33604]|uniref:F-box domain-containing protein n=1 Tax=Jaapia argillacea MUCL 33604 TaxID=933084 RepID=A0A067PVA6_9AGAM|nr:hypothetical protein JAAARDRAFT_35480 [Jaapia argillacea MUCL 33604]